MSIRDPGYDPRRRRNLAGARPAGGRSPGAPGSGPALLPAALAAAALVVVFALGVGGGLLAGGAASPTPTGAALAGGPSAAASFVSSPVPSAPNAASPEASPTPSTSATAPAQGPADVAIVPVTNFRATRTAASAADIRAIAAGTGTLAALVLVERDADGILAALGTDRGAFGARLVTVEDAKSLAANLAANRTRLGFLRADEVDASVRALTWGGKALFGVGRVTSLDAWPLTAILDPVGTAATTGPAATTATAASYDPKTAWTLVAGGDILLDRGVSVAIGKSRRGADFLFDGGTATITGHCKDCSPLGWDLPNTKRTGNAGVVRALVSGADLAIANFENPAPNAFGFHAHGLVFTANPASIAGLAHAGIDWVSLANNHIGNAGRNGILQTMANLDRYGISHSGAGADTTEAHRAALLQAGGIKVGILGYDTIAAYYNAGAATPGSARMTKAALKADIAAARKAGADLVIVFPHWGVEYRATPTAGQQALGRAAIDAGADMVIGNHPHWAGAMEVYRGKPIWYALGNFVFDQTWSEPTMEGITLEMTFRGTDLVQVRVRPHLILGAAQPNFMDPAAAGKVVMSQVFGASKGLLDW